MEVNVAENLRKIKSEIPDGVELIAVSKFHPAEILLQAYNAGQRRFGESRVKEMLEKQSVLPQDIIWHFIGHLQTNKVKQLVGHVSMIESVDSERLLDLVDSESCKANVITNVLMQLHVAKEETKFGFYPEELMEYFAAGKYKNLTHTHICGVMGMASNTDDKDRIKSDFIEINNVFRSIKNMCDDLRGFDIVSMGMSHDWKLAVDEGSNMVRIGTAIFGEREY